jgi:hypothetical protein
MLLLALLTALVVYVLATRAGASGPAAGGAGTRASTPADCPSQGAPSVGSVSRAALRGMREDLRGVMFGRGRRLYEQGVVASSYAWSDSEPGKRMALPRNPRDPAGYELRWWASDGDDVVADVFAFASVGQARDFFQRASSSRCRQSGAALATSSPPGGRDLAWRNPDRFAQEDVYLLRGQRVYRVGVVRARVHGAVTPAARTAAFSLVNGLACALPGGACHPRGDRALAQQALTDQLAFLRRELPGGEPESGAPAEGSTGCRTGRRAPNGRSGSAVSEPLYYHGKAGLRVGVEVYASDAAARKALAHDRAQAPRSCLARGLVSALRERRYRTGTQRARLASAPIGQGAFVVEVTVPIDYDHRSYAWVFDGVEVRQGRIVDWLGTVAPVSSVRIAERLAEQLARLAGGEQG